MSTEFFNDQWRILSNENQNKVSNYSMSFDGTNTKIEFGDVNGFDRTDAFSGSCWVYLTGGSINEYIISKQDDTTRKGYVFYVNSTRKLGVIISRDASVNIAQVLSTSNMPNNTWTHIAFTYDGSSTRAGIKLYINGVLQTLNYYGDSNITGSIVDASLPFQISGRDGITTNAVNGKIDQVSIFDYELSSSQVSTLYGGGTAITNPMTLSPIAYYQLGDQSVDNGANYLVPNNSLSDYVFNFPPNDHVAIGNSTDFNFGTGDFTISFWINFNNFAPYQYIFDFRDSNLTSENVLSMYMKPSLNTIVVTGAGSVALSGNSGTALSSGVWNNVIIKRNNNIVTSHINGANADQTSGVFGLDFNTTPKLNIGANGSGASGVNGKMSNFQIFNTALPQTGSNSIEAIYNNGSPLTSMSGFTSLVAWYKLNASDTFDGSNWTINDYGSGGNDGTSSGMDSSNLVVSDLQQTSGYSPYALDFDGADDYLDCGNANSFEITDSFSGSCWVYLTSTKLNIFMSKQQNVSPYTGYAVFTSSVGNLRFTMGNNPPSYFLLTSTSTIPNNIWTHVAFTYDGSANSTGAKLYMNGILQTVSSTGGSIAGSIVDATIPFQISGRGGATTGAVSGRISNASMFNAELTSTQITEIYNQGVPGNLHNFSGTAPVSWWQLGSNSSFNTNWTCLDEIGTNNAVSVNMTNDDIVDGVGYSASGLGTSSIDIVGDAPYSTANGLSENMDVLDRVTDVAPS